MIRAGSKRFLEVRGLHASIGGVEILKGLDLIVSSGDVHAIMARTARARAPLPMCWPAIAPTR